MICPKCESKLKNDVKYCPRCGYLFNSNDVNFYSEVFNTKLLDVYYPNKSKRVYSNISIPYLLFGYFYAAYMKMYKCAIVTFFAQMFFFFILIYFEKLVFASYGFMFYSIFFLLVGCILIYVYYSINFDKLLLEKRKNKIRTILRLNYDKPYDEIKEIIIKDSKNSKTGLIFSIVVTVMLLVLLFS